MASLLVLNGPNLNMLGQRDPAQYGTATLKDVEMLCTETGADLGFEVSCTQSNHEGDLIEAIQTAPAKHAGIILNAGGYTHTSVALRDAISSVEVPVVEVHISNIHAREPFRHVSLIAPVCAGSIVGFGITGYSLALRGLAERLSSVT